MADAYRLKADASFPSPIYEDENGFAVEVIGRNYAAGDYVLAQDLTTRVRERADAGELDHLLEAVSLNDAVDALNAVETRVVIPEHEAEAVVLEQTGAQIVPRDQVVELNSAGAEAARAAIEASREGGADQRPGITAPEVASITDAGRGDEIGVVPKDSEHVDQEALRGVERPPGVLVGPDLEAASTGEEPKATRKSPPKAAEKREDKPKEEKSGD